MNIIVGLIDVKDGAEKLKGYWDETGLDMHIAVKKDSTVVVETKHWVRKHYVQTNLNTDTIWELLGNMSNKIGRKLIRSEKGPYVYINKLSVKQTQKVFDLLIEELGVSKDDISRVWEINWDIDDAVLPGSISA